MSGLVPELVARHERPHARHELQSGLGQRRIDLTIERDQLIHGRRSNRTTTIYQQSEARSIRSERCGTRGVEGGTRGARGSGRRASVSVTRDDERPRLR